MTATLLNFFCPASLHLLLQSAGGLKSVIISGIGYQMLVIEMDNIIAQRIQNIPVVADNQQGAAVFAQMAFQPYTGLQIQVIGRLVQQQDIGRLKQCGGQGYPHPPAAGEFFYRTR